MTTTNGVKYALDLFCGAGGACRGLQQAGYEVVGVDLAEQPYYPGRFVRGDALRPDTLGLNPADFDLVWASPPCQSFSAALGKIKSKQLNLIPQTRALLAGHPRAIIENVPKAPLRHDAVLTWGMFVDEPPCDRKRIFELSFGMPLAPSPTRRSEPSLICAAGKGGWGRTDDTPQSRRRARAGLPPLTTLAELRTAFGADWIPLPGEPGAQVSKSRVRGMLNAMIPPVYSRWLAEQAERLTARH